MKKPAIERKLSKGCKYESFSPDKIVSKSLILLPYSQGRLLDLRIPYSSPAPWVGKRLRYDQCYLIYALVNWCIDRKGYRIDAWTARTLYSKHNGLNLTHRHQRIFEILRDPYDDLTKRVASNSMIPNHSDFFGPKAIEILRMHDKDAILRSPESVTPL